MKRFLVFIFLLTIVLSGCEITPDVSDTLSFPIKITASLDGSEGQFTADFSAEECSVTFGENHVLSGAVLRFTEDGNTASVGDIFTRSIKKGTFPAQETFVKAIYLLSSTETEGIYENGKMVYAIDEMKILVYYDERNDSITRIETEEGRGRFAFVIASLESYDTQSKSGRIS